MLNTALPPQLIMDCQSTKSQAHQVSPQKQKTNQLPEFLHSSAGARHEPRGAQTPLRARFTGFSEGASILTTDAHRSLMPIIMGHDYASVRPAAVWSDLAHSTYMSVAHQGRHS